jgi:hypothetical protein
MRSLSTSLGVALALMTLAFMTPRQVDAHAAVIPSIIQDEHVVRILRKRSLWKPKP